jgi:hypothetical protein
MMPELDYESLQTLMHFYTSFRNKIIASQIKIENKSVLLTVIKLPVNELSRLLADSTLGNTSLSQREIDLLVYKGCIRALDELGKPHEYAITIAGIWYAESNNNEMDINRLLSYFQETKLSFKVSSKPLKDIEKNILFAMITIRNFSKTVPMDINTSLFRDSWIQIFDICNQFLHKIGVVSKENWNSFHPGNEHSISYVMRRANDLPQKTINIYQYQTPGNNKYFLDVDNQKIPAQKRLMFLCKLILGSIETNELVDSVHSFCCDVAYAKSKMVRESFEYINPDWDTILKDALRNLYYGGKDN